MKTPLKTIAVLFAALVITLVAAGLRAENETINKANRLLQQGDYDGAIEVLTPHTKENPDDGLAWASLANAYHGKGDYEKAAEMNRRAAETPFVRASARYNEACALSLLGRVDGAREALEAAIAAGFLDYDLMETDSDLAALRAKYPISFPAQHEYEKMRAHNGIKLSYKVLLPRGFKADNAYPAVILFAPGAGARSTDWAMAELLGEKDDTQGWIVIYAVGPEEGWFTHPSHHALNELLAQLRVDYQIEGDKFHVAGFDQGARVATTYSQMSREHFQSLTTFSGWHWNNYVDDDLGRAFGMPVRLVVGGKDEFGRDLNTRIGNLMSKQGVDVELVVVDTDDQMLPSVRHGKLIEYIPRARGEARSSN